MDRKKTIEKISTVMVRVEEVAREAITSPDEYLEVCGALLAVTRNMYVHALGSYDTARMFEAVANSFQLQEELLEIVQNPEKPTIH